jgi:hypothetical protein
MTKQIKAVMLASAAAAFAVSAQAQLPVSGYTDNHNDILIGFTKAGSTGDLVIDLGTASQIGVGGTGPVDLNLNGNVGQTSSDLLNQLTGLFGSTSVIQWGSVGGHFTSGANFAIYSTVAHGATAPFAPGAPGQIMGAVNTAGHALADIGGGVTANQAVVDPTQNFGESWTEIVAPGTLSSSFSNKYYNPDSALASVTVEDLYVSTATSQSLLGTLTFTSGNLVFTPVAVPEPATYGALAGLGVLALSLRRQFMRK